MVEKSSLELWISKTHIFIYFDDDSIFCDDFGPDAIGLEQAFFFL